MLRFSINTVLKNSTKYNNNLNVEESYKVIILDRWNNFFIRNKVLFWGTIIVLFLFLMGTGDISFTSGKILDIILNIQIITQTYN